MSQERPRMNAYFAERYLTQGREEGLVKGEAQTLLKQINLKFGEYPDWVEAKLNEADAAQLDHWVANILTPIAWMNFFQFIALRTFATDNQ